MAGQTVNTVRRSPRNSSDIYTLTYQCKQSLTVFKALEQAGATPVEVTNSQMSPVDQDDNEDTLGKVAISLNLIQMTKLVFIRLLAETGQL